MWKSSNGKLDIDVADTYNGTQEKTRGDNVNTFGTMVLLFILVFSSFMAGVDRSSKHYVNHFGRVTEDIKYERETCIRSEPVSVPCKVVFVKETNTSNKE